ncbi:uncharacterized protein LOC105205860 isoform X2 [Solenopsis invicta]|uniref:uncharacterized protein LOC105205860 isoform X2 n=1 Tax=Solenopsis invicta TaxID=13686 RepID=UPI00059586DE|nr:uncharacterized protein LOC105205860 isoform X2 [Solenopsis invicta]
MVVYLLINRSDIMNLFLLGYLCFCVAINLADSSDPETGFPEISENDSSDNCSRCDETEQDTSCVCFEDLDRCVIVCNSGLYCTCPNCNLCWQEQQRLMLVTQIVISVLFALGMVGLVIVYLKICHKTRQHPTRRRHIVLHEAQDLTTQSSIIESLRERPPSYNEVIRNTPSVYTSSCNNAPPLYASPYNRASMQEAPPSYPGTPKPQEKIQDSNEPPSSLPVAQHM